jgi:hypothetical protein
MAPLFGHKNWFANQLLDPTVSWPKETGMKLSNKSSPTPSVALDEVSGR